MIEPIYAALRVALRSEQPVALVTVIEANSPGASGTVSASGVESVEVRNTTTTPHHGVTVSNKLLIRPGAEPLGTLGNAELDRIAARDALAELEAGRSGIRHYGPNGETTPADLADESTVQVFVESWSAPPQMWIFGAVDFTAALARVAKIVGYRVVVCDARPVFATARRFPMADEVRVSWPGPIFEEFGAGLGPRDAVCILTHDPKFDVPAVLGALGTNAGYIGVMGSRRTHDDRLRRLGEVGLDDPTDLDRLMSPIGLDIGARTPEETAISIVAEIIAQRTGRDAPSLRDGSGPIHRRD